VKLAESWKFSLHSKKGICVFFIAYKRWGVFLWEAKNTVLPSFFKKDFWLFLF
jgi:hypothetical protein